MERLEDSSSGSRFLTGLLVAGIILGVGAYLTRGAISEKWQQWRANRSATNQTAKTNTTPTPTATPTLAPTATASPEPTATPLPSIADLATPTPVADSIYSNLPDAGPEDMALIPFSVAVAGGLILSRYCLRPAQKSTKNQQTTIDIL